MKWVPNCNSIQVGSLVEMTLFVPLSWYNQNGPGSPCTVAYSSVVSHVCLFSLLFTAGKGVFTFRDWVQTHSGRQSLFLSLFWRQNKTAVNMMGRNWCWKNVITIQYIKRPKHFVTNCDFDSGWVISSSLKSKQMKHLCTGHYSKNNGILYICNKDVLSYERIFPSRWQKMCILTHGQGLSYWVLFTEISYFYWWFCSHMILL